MGDRKKDRIAVDFDGVIHSYMSGWQGATVIPDPPVPGAIAWMLEVMEEYTVAINSTRTAAGGFQAMVDYLLLHGMPLDKIRELEFPKKKPVAIRYIDDRGFHFKGKFPSVSSLKSFKPWRMKEKR